MIIGVAGYARSGKDEVAKILVNKFGFTRIAFADEIRKFLLKVNPILESGNRVGELVHDFGWEIAKSKTETRRLMQEIGVSAREMFGDDFWVNIALKNVHSTDNVVVPDVRFQNEITAIRNMEGKVFRVMREGVGPVNSHISETEIDKAYFDGYIPNDGTLEDLEAYVTYLMRPYANQII